MSKLQFTHNNFCTSFFKKKNLNQVCWFMFFLHVKKIPYIVRASKIGQKMCIWAVTFKQFWLPQIALFPPNFRVLYGALAHKYISYTHARRLASHVNDCTHSWNKTVAKIMTGLFRGWSNGQIGRQGEYFTKEKWTSISAGRFIGSNLMMRPTTGALTLWGKINESSDIMSKKSGKCNSDDQPKQPKPSALALHPTISFSPLLTSTAKKWFILFSYQQ